MAEVQVKMKTGLHVHKGKKYKKGDVFSVDEKMLAQGMPLYNRAERDTKPEKTVKVATREDPDKTFVNRLGADDAKLLALEHEIYKDEDEAEAATGADAKKKLIEKLGL